MSDNDFDKTSERRYEKGFFAIQPDAVKLLLDLVIPNDSDSILILASGTELTAAAQSRGVQVVEASADHPALIDNISNSGPYGGAIIVPPFNFEVINPSVPNTWPPLRRWFAEEYFIAHSWSQLAPGARVIALVSSGLLSLAQRQSARQALLGHGLLLVVALPNDLFWTVPHHAGTYLVICERRNPITAPVQLVDASNETSLPPSQAFREWAEGRAFPAMDVRPVAIEPHELNADFRIDPAFYDPIFLELQAPPGFREYRLGDITEISAGVRVDPSDRLTTREGSSQVPFVQVRHLRAGAIDQPYWINLDTAAGKRALPGDILVSSSGTIGKVVLVGPEFPDGVLFDTSVRRVRIAEEIVSPKLVSDFLQSELGQQQFRRLTSGTVIPHISSAHLSQMRVFLPIALVDGSKGEVPDVVETAPVLTQAQALAQAIEEKVLTVLHKPEDDRDETWRERVASTLRQLAAELAPKSISDVVRQDFPAPLAIAYRRYYRARHNPYEQLNRLVSLVEACTYFAFHILLADYSRGAWRDRVVLPKEATQALKPRATFDDRIRFVRAVTEMAQLNGIEWFMPELIEADLGSHSDRFRTELRNPVAHSAPGSEAYVFDLLQKYQVYLEEMLKRLRFLSQYSMCRIRSCHFHQGEWHYRIEVYRGEEYDVNIQDFQPEDVADEGRLIAAEREHLVLISPEYEVLDLWPYYQSTPHNSSRLQVLARVQFRRKQEGVPCAKPRISASRV